MNQAQIKRLLPAVFQQVATPGNPMSAVLDLMQTMHEPPESTLEELEAFFDPRRTPDKFVPYLAGWVDLGVLLEVSRGSSSAVSLSTGLGRLRELTASAAMLSEWRGTRKGLLLFLEIATGMAGFEVDEQVRDEDGKLRVFHLRVTAPHELMAHRTLIERIIELEKPAYVTYELVF